MRSVRILTGDVFDALRKLDAGSINCVVTSPPYWGLRSYSSNNPKLAKKEIGTEATPELYVAKIIRVFDLIWNVLRDDGTVWLNIGDSYGTHGCAGVPGKTAKVGSNLHKAQVVTNKLVSGIKSKDLVGIPWRAALALREKGWYLRADVVWSKKNGQPQANVKDRPTTSHEYIFLLSKSQKYYYDAEAISEPYETKPGKTKNRRSVWSFPTQHYHGAHFAVMPTQIAELCVKAGTPRGGLVLDPFCGSGTVLETAVKLGRRAVGIELIPEFAQMAKERILKASQ